MLAREAEKNGVTLYTPAKIIHSQRTSGGQWLLTVDGRSPQGQAPVQVITKFVVDATGRRAAFATQQGARRILFDQLLGMFVFFRFEDGHAPTDAHTLVEAWEEGWWYSALLPDSRMVVACLTDADIVKKHRLNSLPQWTECLDGTQHTKQRLQPSSPDAQPSVHVAHTQRLDRVTGDGWLAVGDAASTFDPLSSQGIFKALRAGILASYAICDSFKGDRSGLQKYETLVAQEFEEYFGTRREYYQQERRWDSSPFWMRRHGRISLDPRQSLCARDAVNVETLTMHLSRPDLKLLHSLCRPPRPAHEIVSAFKSQSQNPIPDRRIIQTLQYLIDQGAICPSK
jgi:flavin-dependent dehydrogenase